MSGGIWWGIGSGRLVSIVDRGSATLALTFSTCDHWRVRRLYKTGLPLSPLGMIDWSRVFWPRITATASERIPRSRRRSSSFDASVSHWTLDLLLRDKKRKKERLEDLKTDDRCNYYYYYLEGENYKSLQFYDEYLPRFFLISLWICLT